MKSFTKGWTIGLLIAVIGGGTLLASPGDSSSQTVDPRIQVSTNMSLAEMLDRAKDIDHQINDDLQHVVRLKEIARKQKDLIKLTCINDKLIALKAQANIFDDEHRSLESIAPDSGDRFPVFTSLTETSEASHRLRSDADACVGEPELAGESTNGYYHPPFPDDPTIGDPFQPGIEPPGYASPYN